MASLQGALPNIEVSTGLQQTSSLGTVTHHPFAMPQHAPSYALPSSSIFFSLVLIHFFILVEYTDVTFISQTHIWGNKYLVACRKGKVCYDKWNICLIISLYCFNSIHPRRPEMNLISWSSGLKSSKT